MTALLALLRHGPTEWNRLGRMQGRADIPLNDSGRDTVRAWRLGPQLRAAHWFTSPLGRARETAALLGVTEAAPDAALTEMDWGDWEGRTIADLRADLGPRMRELEDRGLDFRPDGGESPRDVQVRMRPWLTDRAKDGGLTAAVTHKGVIRAVMALAYDWDMRGKAPIKLAWDRVHVFALSGDGQPAPHAINHGLDQDIEDP